MFGDLFENVFGLQFVGVRLDESEKTLRTIYRIYKDQERGLDPEESDLDIALEGMEKYYRDYLDYWKKGLEKRTPAKLKQDFQKRYNEIVSAISSGSFKDKVIALDNGINQWHMDYPVLSHLGFEAELEDEEGISDTLDLTADIEDLLTRLGRLPKESPYIRK